LLTDELRRLDTLSGDRDEVLRWFRARRGEQVTPEPALKRTMEDIRDIEAQLQMLEAVELNQRLFDLKMSLAYWRMYRILKRQYNESPTLDAAAYLLSLNADLQIMGLEIASELVPLDAGIADACNVISTALNSYQQRLNQPDVTFINEDLEEVLRFEAMAQSLRCVGLPDGVEIARQINQKILNDIQTYKVLSPEVLAGYIRRYGPAGKALVYQRLNSAIVGIGEPATKEDFFRLVKFYHFTERLSIVPEPPQSEVDHTMDLILQEHPSTDLTELQPLIKDNLKKAWDKQWNGLFSAPNLSDSSTIDALVGHISLAEELNRRIDTLGIEIESAKTHVKDKLTEELNRRTTTYIESLRVLTPESINAIYDEGAIQGLKALDSITHKLSEVWGVDMPDSDSVIKEMVTQDLQALQPGADLTPLWFWPTVFDLLDAKQSRKIFVDRIKDLITVTAQKAQTGDMTWEDAIRSILDMVAQAQLLGWELDISTVEGEGVKDIILNLLVAEYQEAKAEVEANRNEQWNTVKSAIERVLSVEALNQALGLDMYSHPSVTEGSYVDLMNYIGSVLDESSVRIADCTFNTTPSCKEDDLKEILEITALAQALGVPQAGNIIDRMNNVRDSYFQGAGNIRTPESLFSSWPTIEKMVLRDMDSRQRAAQIIQSVIGGVGSLTDENQRAFFELYNRIEGLKQLQVSYTVQEPDPLNGPLSMIEQRFDELIAGKVSDAEEQFLNSEAKDWEMIFSEMEKIGKETEAASEAAVKNLQTAVQEFVTTGAQDPYKRVAEILRPVLDRAGADLKLAYHLSSTIGTAEVIDELRFRSAYARELAVFAVGAEQWRLPLVLGSPEELLGWLFSLAEPRAQANAKTDILNRIRLLFDNMAQPGSIVGSGIRFVGELFDRIAEGSLTIDPEFMARDFAEQVESTTEQLWLKIVTRTLTTQQNAEALGRTILSGINEIFNADAVRSFIEVAPNEVRFVAAIFKDLNTAVQTQLQQSQDILTAFVYSLSDIAFADMPLVRDISKWTFDMSGIRDGTTGYNEILNRLTMPEGVVSLTCILNSNIQGLDISPLITYLPTLAVKRIMTSSDSSAGGLLRTTVDIGADVINALFRANNISCEYGAPELPEEDVPLAEMLRRLPDIATITDGVGLVGEMTITSVETFESLAQYDEHTFSRVLKILWWGTETKPVDLLGNGMYKVLYKGLRQEMVDVLEVALQVPELVKNVADVLYQDPNLRSFMNILSGRCEDQMLLPPDRCNTTPSGSVPNMLLYVLDRIRFETLKSELGGNLDDITRQRHEGDPQWGYLKTVPVLSVDDNGNIQINTENLTDAWNDFAENMSALEDNMDNLKKAGVGMIDLARMTINMVASLPTADEVTDASAAVLGQSVFARQVGGDSFTGIAGGLIKSWDVAQDPSQAALYFELVGQFAIPLITKIAAQFSYQQEGSSWSIAVKAGGNYPNYDFICNTFNIAGCSSQGLAELVGSLNADAYLAGWLGKDSNDTLYAELYTKASVGIGAFSAGSVVLSGFAVGFDQIENIRFGICAEGTMPNPFALLFNFIGMGVEASGGGYIFKEDSRAGIGYRVGVSGTIAFPVFPIVSLTVGGDSGANFETTTVSGLNVVPESLPSLGQMLEGLSGGAGLNLHFSGRILTYEIREDMPVEYRFYNLGYFGREDREYGIKIRFGNFVWMVITNRRLIVGDGAYPKPGEKRRYASISIDTLIANPNGDPVEDAFNLVKGATEYVLGSEQEVGSWAGWSEGAPYSLFSGDMCGIKRAMSTGQGITSRRPPIEAP